MLEGLVAVDPAMDLLLSYISATPLRDMELLLAIRIILRSLDLIQDSNSGTAKLLTDRGHVAEEDEDCDVNMQLDQLEEQLQVLEHHLGDGSSSQARGLTLACAMLGRQPAGSTVRAMRALFQPHEVLSMIYLFRIELVRGAWTTRYLDPTVLEDEAGLEPPPDGTLVLIADLIARCLDALGPGGWLQNDAVLYGSPADGGNILTALRLEVNAALEGTQEAVRLSSLLGETVGYGRALKRTMAAATPSGKKAGKPVTMRPEGGREGQRLPLGLKTPTQPISASKVVSGGEVVWRTARERGHLTSKRVGPYTLERLTF
jgi:hypothetical protein